MTKRFAHICALILVTAIGGRVRAQVVSRSAPTFEVASVKRADPKVRPARPATGGDPRRVTYLHYSLSAILGNAYKVGGFQIVGPSWLDSESYDIIAKASDNAPVEQIPLMMQALLAERFNFKAHRETRSLPVYALTVGKNGPKMRQANPDGKSGMGFGGTEMVAEKTDMVNFAGILTIFMDRPVVDLTELRGDYAFSLSVNVNELQQMKSGIPKTSTIDGPPSIFTAVEQLGLKLDPRKVPMEMLIIDSVEKIPTEN